MRCEIGPPCRYSLEFAPSRPSTIRLSPTLADSRPPDTRRRLSTLADQFGDITRKFSADAQSQLSAAVSNFTGQEGYEFGDVSRKLLDDADRALATARDQYFDDLPAVLWRQLFQELSVPQRRDLAVALCQLLATFLVAYNVIANVGLAGSIALAWGVSCHRTGLSPLAPGMWTSYLATLTTLGTVMSPLLLPVRVLLAIAITPSYRRLVSALQGSLPLRSKPGLNRVLALLVVWLAGGFITACVAVLGVSAASKLAGVALVP